jgi:hypothetical protein
MKVLPILLLLIPSMLSVSDKEWTLKKEKDGIVIYSRPSNCSKFNDLRIEMDVHGDVSQLAAILLDVESYPQWAYATKSATAVKKLGANELIYYSEIEAPWPACNRDFYASLKVCFNTTTHSMNAVSTSMKDYQPEKKNLVRIPQSCATWNVTTLSDKMIHVQYTLQVDPGGSIPSWILNMFATKGPLETFGNLKKKIEALNP